MLQFEDSDDSVAKFLLPMDVFSVTTAACSFRPLSSGILLSLLFSCRLENSVHCLISGLFNYAFYHIGCIVSNGKFIVIELL